MRAVVQRVSEASVSVGGEVVGAIGTGLVVLLGVARDADWLSVDAIGEGEEYRTRFANDHGSVLAVKDTVVHGSVVTGA